MRNIVKKLIFVLTCLFTVITIQHVNAQGADEQRFQVELQLKEGNKEVSCKLNSVALSFTRYASNTNINASTDSIVTGKTNSATPNEMIGDAIYINIDAAVFPAEPLKLLTKKQAQLTGKIIVTDTYSKTIAKTITFDKAVLNSFSDQLSSYGYAGRMGNMGISLTCKTIVIDGTVIEP